MQRSRRAPIAAAALSEAALGAASVDPFLAFLTTLPLRFFPLCMLIFVVIWVLPASGPVRLWKRESRILNLPKPGHVQRQPRDA